MALAAPTAVSGQKPTEPRYHGKHGVLGASTTS